MKIMPIKGMPDFYPEDQEILEYLRDKWLQLGSLFGYQNYEGPILEPIELYLEKTSEEIVKEQTFLVNDRKNKTYVMRPEMTPTLARMIVKKEFELSVPIRWQTFGRFFRYEKPQKGRTRAFYQWNIDLIGEDGITSDLEILEIAANSLRILGLSSDQVKIKFSNRTIIQNILMNDFGLTMEQTKEALRVLDRIDKVSAESSKAALVNLDIEESSAQSILEFFLDDSYKIEDDWLQKLQEYSKKLGFSEYLEFDKKIIRGFDYYTGLVFEAWAESAIKRAIFGGGRYDNLTQTMGGKRTLPGVGFAIGDVALTEVLKEFGKLPQREQPKFLFIPLSEQAFIKCKQYSAKLQEKNYQSSTLNNYQIKLQKALKYANSEQYPYAVIVGDDELKANTIRLKNLEQYQETIIDSEDKIGTLLELVKQRV